MPPKFGMRVRNTCNGKIVASFTGTKVSMAIVSSSPESGKKLKPGWSNEKPCEGSSLLAFVKRTRILVISVNSYDYCS